MYFILRRQTQKRVEKKQVIKDRRAFKLDKKWKQWKRASLDPQWSFIFCEKGMQLMINCSIVYS